MLDSALEYTLNAAIESARENKHAYVTVEHLLLALLDNTSALNVLLGCGANIGQLRTKLTHYIAKTTQVISMQDNERQTEFHPNLQFVFQAALNQAQTQGHTKISGANMLAAMFIDSASRAVAYIEEENITRSDVENYIQGETPKSEPAAPHKPSSPPETSSSTTTDEKDPLHLYTTNLNERTARGLIDPLIGRDEEIQRTIQVLCRRSKNNALLIGEAGVGKTAIAEGLAKLIIDGNVPTVLRNSVIYSLDLGLLIAGTKYRGDFEQRLKDVLDRLMEQKHAILFIDEIHTIIGAGSSSGNSLDVSNLIKPMLSTGVLTCIGSTTYKEYRTIFAKDHALDRRFQKIDIKEPTVEQTVDILKGLRSRFEKHHQLYFSDEALEAAAKLSDRYISDRHLPDKAIDIIDEVGAYQFLLKDADRKKTITVTDIEHMIAKMAHIPEKNVSVSDKEVLRNLPNELKKVIFGQDEAIDTLSAAVKLSRSGLRDINKPIGSFLLVGPTGVGKTEVCKQLSTILGIELLRFDMSEYMESHTAARLIGAPPGYVGYEEGGVLTEAVNRTPHAIVLLDEIEKAHPDIFNLLLQIMDHGTLTDMNGRMCDFRHTIVVMTSNIGASDIENTGIGFLKIDNTNEVIPSVNRVFSPEFRNRLDAIIQFQSLDSTVILAVVDKYIRELEVQLHAKQIELEVDDAARIWLAQNGYDRAMGARPVNRLIDNQLKKPLADELLFGRLMHGGHVKVTIENAQIKFLISNKRDNVITTTS